MALPTSMDTSEVKESKFEPLPKGTYDATVFSVEECESPGSGKMPEGTPGINVQFRIANGEYENRRVFKRFYIAPDGYENKQTMDSILFTFCKIALGEDTARNKKFNLAKAVAEEEFSGAPCRVQVEVNGEYNNVKNVREPGAGSEDDEDLLP